MQQRTLVGRRRVLGACAVTATECVGNVGEEYITSVNIHSFEGCTVIQGAIRILQTSLNQ